MGAGGDGGIFDFGVGAVCVFAGHEVFTTVRLG